MCEGQTRARLTWGSVISGWVFDLGSWRHQRTKVHVLLLHWQIQLIERIQSSKLQWIQSSKLQRCKDSYILTYIQATFWNNILVQYSHEPPSSETAASKPLNHVRQWFNATHAPTRLASENVCFGFTNFEGLTSGDQNVERCDTCRGLTL